MKNNKPRGKWEKKIKFPKSDTPIKNLSFLESFIIFLKNPAVVIKKGAQIISHQHESLIKDKWYKDRLDVDLSTYLNWYFTSKGFLHSIDWMGIPTRKIPMDLWIYQEIIVETKPDFIIEIGALYGGSTLFLAQICDELNNGKVVSIDINRDFYMAQHERIIAVTGDSTSNDIFSQVRNIINNGTVMIIHDGDHNADAVLHDLELYAPLVTKGMYLIIEDGVVDLYDSTRSKLGVSYPNGGPLVAARKFLRLNKGIFEMDARRERFILTTNPEGYLRRI